VNRKPASLTEAKLARENIIIGQEPSTINYPWSTKKRHRARPCLFS